MHYAFFFCWRIDLGSYANKNYRYLIQFVLLFPLLINKNSWLMRCWISNNFNNLLVETQQFSSSNNDQKFAFTAFKIVRFFFSFLSTFIIFIIKYLYRSQFTIYNFDGSFCSSVNHVKNVGHFFNIANVFSFASICLWRCYEETMTFLEDFKYSATC